jgi:hypothetical protein
MAERVAAAVMIFRTRFFPIDLFGLTKTEDRLAPLCRRERPSSSKLATQTL